MNLSGRAVLLTVISVCNRGKAQLPNERLFVGYANACSVSTTIQKITDLPAVLEFLRTGV